MIHAAGGLTQIPDPTGYQAWGYLGAVVFLAIVFLLAILIILKAFDAREKRREESETRRDEDMRNFFTQISGGNEARINEMKATAGGMDGKLDMLLAKIDLFLSRFDGHDTQNKALIAAVNELRVELARQLPKQTTRGRTQ